jgi:hypothetical protein
MLKLGQVLVLQQQGWVSQLPIPLKGFDQELGVGTVVVGLVAQGLQQLPRWAYSQGSTGCPKIDDLQGL